MAMIKERNPLGILDLASKVGSDEALNFIEYDGGVRLREQEPDSEGWIAVPAELNTTGVYGRFGYYESQEMDFQGWCREHAEYDLKKHKFINRSFMLHNVEYYGIQMATFIEQGFCFHPEDVRLYRAWLEFDNWHYHLRHEFEEWAREYNVYFMGHGKGTPEYDIADKRRRALAGAERWAENFYLHGQHLGPVWIRGKLPEGWSMQDGGHMQGLWTVLAKPDGTEGGVIYYKAYELCYMRLTFKKDEETGRVNWDESDTTADKITTPEGRNFG